MTCPRRPLMLSKERWKPNKVQSNFVKKLIEYEKSLRPLKQRPFSSELHCDSEPFDSCYRSHAFTEPGDEWLSPTGATQASDTPTRPFTPIPRESSGGIEARPRSIDSSLSTTEEFDGRSKAESISYWGQQWVRLSRQIWKRVYGELPSFLVRTTRRGGVRTTRRRKRKVSLMISLSEVQQGPRPSRLAEASDTPACSSSATLSHAP